MSLASTRVEELRAILTPEQHHALLGALMNACGVDAYSDVLFFPATPTNWATTFGIMVNKRWYVLRMNNLRTTTFSDRRAEAKVSKNFARAGISPRVYSSDPNVGITLMEYIIGEPVSALTTPQISGLTELLKRIHRTSTFRAPNLDGTKYRRAIRRVKRICRRHPEYLIYESAIAHFETISDRLHQDTSGLVFAHNDLNKSNILFDKSRAWAIDLDHVGINDYLFDIATIVLSFKLTARKEAILLRSYLGREPTSYETARLFVVKQHCLLRYGIITFSLINKYAQLPSPPELFDSLPGSFIYSRHLDESQDLSIYRLSLAFLKESLANITSPRFDEVSSTLSSG